MCHEAVQGVLLLAAEQTKVQAEWFLCHPLSTW